MVPIPRGPAPARMNFSRSLKARNAHRTFALEASLLPTRGSLRRFKQ